jgi:ribosomal protein L9
MMNRFISKIPRTSTAFNIYNRHASSKTAKKTIRIILTEDLPDGNGYAGDVQSVSAGYARNYLIPKRKALYATPENFARTNIMDPELVQESEAEKKARLSQESDEDLKAADFLRYYLRNKTLKIWRTVDASVASSSGIVGTSVAGTPIHPGIVDAKMVRDKLSKQLKIDLEDHEIVQIHPEIVNHSLLEEEDAVQEELKKMEPLGEDRKCNVQLKTLGEYLVKIHLRGNQEVGLRLVVLKR